MIFDEIDRVGDFYKSRIIFEVIKIGNYEIFKFLIEHCRLYDGDLKLAKDINNNPLAFAIYHDRYEFVKILLEQKTCRFECEEYAIDALADTISLKYLKLFVEYGIELRCLEELYDAAVINNNTEMIEYLLDIGVKPRYSAKDFLLEYTLKIKRDDLYTKFKNTKYSGWKKYIKDGLIFQPTL